MSFKLPQVHVLLPASLTPQFPLPFHKVLSPPIFHTMTNHPMLQDLPNLLFKLLSNSRGSCPWVDQVIVEKFKETNMKSWMKVIPSEKLQLVCNLP